MRNKFLGIRCNVMNLTTIESFFYTRGNVIKDIKNVAFVRFLGINKDFEKKLYNMENSLDCTNGYYSRIENLMQMTDYDESIYYGNCYQDWKIENKIKLSSLKEDDFLRERLSFAMGETINAFQKTSDNTSSTMEKNFGAKLLFWFDKIASEYLKKDINSFKFVFCNINKKQAYLFAYLLTLMGADVLLIQVKEDIDGKLDQLGFSLKTKIGEFSDKTLQKYVQNSSKIQSDAQKSNSVSKDHTNDFALQNENRVLQEVGKKVVNVRHPKREQNKQSLQNSPIQNAQRRILEYEELANLASSIVMLACYDSQGTMISSGSGIMIGRAGYILTNNHVVRPNAYSYGVRIENDDKTYEVTDIIKYNHLLDLAIVRIEKQLNPIPIYKEEQKLVRGQKVIAIGSPLGLFNSVSDGIISGFRKFNEVDMIQFTAPISPGSSGGAVLNMYGEVIGISTAGFDEGQNINLAVGYEYINQFVKSFV